MSSNDIAISVENVSKRYRIGLRDEKEDKLTNSVWKALKSPLVNFRKYRSLYNFGENEGETGHERADIIWVLRDISFEVKRGEMLGIIGTNGAGKSTLLKILSRITSPTYGKVEIKGRVSSLLEVGTGFHQELTGRENVYLNGTILGMKKKGIDRVFDQIVEFSGIEKFLDTPVKRYSSGMRVRLAFAVSAHLEPEILIIDEVLAVGDAAFQKKCINKMQDVGKEGRTVLFVSHNMAAITRMCQRVILLNEGRKLFDGRTTEVVRQYLKGDKGSTALREWKSENAPGGSVAKLCAIRARSEDNSITEAIDIRSAIQIEIEYDVLESGYVLLPSFTLWSEDGICVCEAVDLDPEWRSRARPAGKYITTAWIPGNLLGEGMLTVSTALYTLEPSRELQYAERDVIGFQLVDSLDGDSARGDWPFELTGLIRPWLKWSTRTETDKQDSTSLKIKAGT